MPRSFYALGALYNARHVPPWILQPSVDLLEPTLRAQVLDSESCAAIRFTLFRSDVVPSLSCIVLFALTFVTTHFLEPPV